MPKEGVISNNEIMNFLIEFKSFVIESFLTKQDFREQAGNFVTKDYLKETLNEFGKQFATKEDLKNFATKQDIKVLEENMTGIIFGLDAKIDMVEESLQDRITSVESRLRLDINRLDGRIDKLEDRMHQDITALTRVVMKHEEYWNLSPA